MSRKAKSETVQQTSEVMNRLAEPPTKEQVEAVQKAKTDRMNERMALMDSIADKAESDIELKPFDGDKIVIDDAEEKERRAAEEDKAAEQEMQAEHEDVREEENKEVEAQAEEDTDTKVVNGVTHYLQIVNGREKWQTLEEIRRTASKVEAADEYLTTAKEAATNAARLALSPKDEPSNVEKIDIKKTLSLAIMGDEGAIDKLASALEVRPSAVTPDVLQLVDRQISFRTELASLESEQRDILDDPWLSRLFKGRLAEMKAEDPTQSLSTAYRSIGKELRSAFPEKFKKVSVSQEKLDRKKTLVNAPSAAGRQTERTDEQEEETVEMTIEKMAKSRGQPYAVRHAKH
jgi:hypothetical protein